MKSSDVERRVSRAGVRRRHARVAGDRDQRADLAVARRLDLLGQGRRPEARRRTSGRPRTRELQRPIGAGRPAAGLGAEFDWPAAASGNIAPPGRSRLPVSDVEDVDEPARERAELLRAGADPPVDGGALGAPRARAPCGAISSAAMPVAAATASGVKGSAQRAHLVDPADELLEATERHQALVEDHVDQRREQQRVGAGPDEVVLVGVLGGARAARVDDDDLAAALADRAQATARVRRRHQRAVGRQRVRAEHEQVPRAVEVRDRDRQCARRTSASSRSAWAAGRRSWRSRCSSIPAPCNATRP